MLKEDICDESLGNIYSMFGQHYQQNQAKAFRKLINHLPKEQHTVQNAAGHIPGIKETSKHDMIADYQNTAFPSACKVWDAMIKIPCDHTGCGQTSKL